MNSGPISPFDGLIDLFPSDILWEIRKRERGEREGGSKRGSQTQTKGNFKKKEWTGHDA